MPEEQKDELVDQIIEESTSKKEIKDFFDNWREYSKNFKSLSSEQEWKLLKEYFYSFLPMVSMTDKVVQTTRPPALPIGEVLAAWVEYDSKAYDDFKSTDKMTYHVMLPTKEVCEDMNIDPELGYSGNNAERVRMRRRVVKDGELYQPITIALGKNGRAALIWGKKDLVAAYDAGLKQVPVVFEYHRQV